MGSHIKSITTDCVYAVDLVLLLHMGPQTLEIIIYLLQSSRKRFGFSLSHFIFHVFSVLFLILWVCCCHYDLKNIMFVRGFALSWWVFFDWELVFLTLLLLFIWSLCSVSWMCCFIHIMFLVFCHIICHLSLCDAHCLLDSELLLFIIIFDCLFHLLRQCCLWFLGIDLVLVSVIEWNLPVSYSYT